MYAAVSGKHELAVTLINGWTGDTKDFFEEAYGRCPKILTKYSQMRVKSMRSKDTRRLSGSLCQMSPSAESLLWLKSS